MSFQLNLAHLSEDVKIRYKPRENCVWVRLEYREDTTGNQSESRTNLFPDPYLRLRNPSE